VILLVNAGDQLVKSKVTIVVFGVVVALTLLISRKSPAQQPSESRVLKGRNPLSEVALGQTTWVEQFDVSPDGRQIVFKSARGGNYNLWTVPVDGGEPKQLTFYQVPFRAKNPRWSPDGRWIAYQVDQHLTRQSELDDVCVIPASGGEPRNLTNTTWSNETDAVWSPDSKYLAFTSSQGRWLNDSGALMGGGIVRVELATGNLKQLSQRGGSDLQWSPDGRFIAYSANRVRDEQTFLSNRDLYMIPSNGGEERLLTPGTMGFKEQDPAWSPDSRKLAFVTDRNGFDNVAVLDVSTGDTKSLTETLFDHANPTWSPDGKSIAYEINQQYNYYIETISPDGGAPARVTERRGVNGGMERIQLRGTLRWLANSRQIAYTYMSPANTSDLWISDAKGDVPRRITDSRAASMKNEGQFVWPELVQYPSFDGLEVQGLLYKPKGVVDGDQAPFMLFYRANASGQHPVGWQPYIQYYVSKGYVVFAPNFRGSTGLGKKYFESIHTHGGDYDIKDAMAGVDLLIKRKLIDPDRMGMVGGSTGGYFVLATLIQRPKTFKAGIAFYTGTSDMAGLIDMSGPGDELGWGGTMIGGTPLSNPKHFYDRSLIYFVEPIQTPLMFFFAQGDIYVGGLREIVPVLDHYGKEYTYKIYEKEPHGWYHWRPEDVQDSLVRIGKFIDSKILGMSGS
jgi:dipeptidyl aminopeptidase/acylaminoacyl peptidase